MSAIWDTFKFGRENPFYSEPLQKGFYHPSPPRKLDRHLKQTLLSADCGSADVPAEDGMRDSFLNVNDGYRMRRVGELGLFPDGESVSLNESWPQSERPSTISIPEIENLTPTPAWQPKGNIPRTEREQYLRSEFSNDEGKKNIQMENQESTLSKYINRFRNAQPLSREERKKSKSTDAEDFWWLRSPVPPQTSPAQCTHQESNGLTSQQKLRSKELLAKHTKHGKQSEREELMLERTNSLLEKSFDQSLMSSNPVVSTIGLGSDSGGTVVTFDEEPFIPAFIQSRERSARALPSTSRPEDDILYRYRLRRKRELAKEEAERRRMKSDSSHFVNQLPSSLKEPRPSDSVQVTNERVPVEPSKPSETPIVQQLNNGLPSTEAKRDAVIQTSDDYFYPPRTYVPIACPHVVQSGMVSVVGPHCHFNCDILSANHSSEDQRKPFRVSSKNKRGQNSNKVLQFEGNVGGKNEILQDTGTLEAQSLSNNMRSLHQGLDHEEDSPTRLTPQKTMAKSSRPPKFCKDVVAKRHELSDTEVWQTTDNEAKEKRLSFEAEDLRQDKKLVGHFQESRFRTADSKYAGGEPCEHESDVHRSRIKQKKLKILKKQSLKSAYSAAGDQAFIDQSVMTSVSSLDNFELSSLDLKAVELTGADEPVHDAPTFDSHQPYLNSSTDPADSITFSDGEEFRDDDILCDLRVRRQSCIQRLIELDNFIQNFK